MFLSQIKLTNFRNYKSLSLTFDKRPVVLLGNNAVGKSNFLEAIYFLSTTKSIRVEKEEELIYQGEDFAGVEGIVQENNNDTNLRVVLEKREGKVGKRVLLNGIGRRVVDYLGNLPAVIFYPWDINMVTGSPSLRRWHLDLALAQVDPEYKRARTLYEQYLISRNRVLKRIKEGLSDQSELEYWTSELIKWGEVITRKRQLFFEFINNFDHPLGGFQFNYQTSLINQDRLKQYQQSEIAASSTLVGPHRDDFSFDFNSRNMARFGSRGEQRLATLTFKFATLEFMAEIYGSRPLLLLDDIFSELDAPHRKAVLKIIPKQQTIIATVEIENIPKSFLDTTRVIQIKNGNVS